MNKVQNDNTECVQKNIILIKQWKKALGTLLCPALRWAIGDIVARGCLHVIKNDTTKKWMDLVGCYFLKMYLTQALYENSEIWKV